MDSLGEKLSKEEVGVLLYIKDQIILSRWWDDGDDKVGIQEFSSMM